MLGDAVTNPGRGISEVPLPFVTSQQKVKDGLLSCQGGGDEETAPKMQTGPGCRREKLFILNDIPN